MDNASDYRSEESNGCTIVEHLKLTQRSKSTVL